MYDLGIIGAGPAGYVAAERAGAAGLKVVLFDERKLGGVCLNEGCIPTKTILYSAKMIDNAKEAAKYGVLIDQVSFDFSKIMQRKNKVVTKLVAGIAAAMKRFGVDFINSRAKISGKKDQNIIISADNKEFLCKNILISTGSESFIPPIKGLEREKILTNREILELEVVPKSLIIIGGGVIGMEFGSFFNSLGTQVSIIEMMDEILPGIDRELSSMLRKEYEKKGITFYLNSKVVEIQNEKIIFEKEGISQNIEAEKILMSVGRRPITKDLGLEVLGIELDRNAIKIDAQCRTNIPNVYAAGDVKGFAMLAHTASREGEVVVNNIMGIKDKMTYHANPGVVYTNPELSSVGITEDEAKKKGIEVIAATFPMAFSGRFVAENEGKNGVIKMVVGKKYHEILGVHILGNPSSEIISAATIAVEMQLRLDDIKTTIFPHPTVGELLKEIAYSFSH